MKLNEYKVTEKDYVTIKEMAQKLYVDLPIFSRDGFLAECYLKALCAFLKQNNLTIVDGNVVKNG